MNSHRVLAIDPTGVVTTMAGPERQPGSDATHLNRPAAVLVHGGWLRIADLDNHRICAVPLSRYGQPWLGELLEGGGRSPLEEPR